MSELYLFMTEYIYDRRVHCHHLVVGPYPRDCSNHYSYDPRCTLRMEHLDQTARNMSSEIFT